VYSDHTTFEVSTFRREPTMDERKGRDGDEGLMVWRDNEWGSLEQDARRRDFTVNAIYYDPLREKDAIYDIVGGMADIEAKVVRTIGDPTTRMKEDPVRMLRACKLAGHYDFEFEPGLHATIQESAEELAKCSQARMLEEHYKIFKKPYTRATFAACRRMGLLKHLLPCLDAIWDEPTGQLAQRLLEVRDSRLAAGTIFPSRVTGLAMVVLPTIWAEFGDPESGELWNNYMGIDKDVHYRVRELLEPYKVPRHMVAKIRETLILQPRLLYGGNRRRTTRHPQYARGRDVFSIFAEAASLDPSLVNRWPEPTDDHERGSGDDEGNDEEGGGGRRRRRRGGRRRGGRRR
jgi:poly(A) polymerase